MLTNPNLTKIQKNKQNQTLNPRNCNTETRKKTQTRGGLRQKGASAVTGERSRFQRPSRHKMLSTSTRFGLGEQFFYHSSFPAVLGCNILSAPSGDRPKQTNKKNTKSPKPTAPWKLGVLSAPGALEVQGTFH